MIDTHCHLNLDPLVKDYHQHYNDAVNAGVDQLIVPGVNYESSQKAVAIAAELDSVYPAIGLHPHEAEQLLTTQSTQEIYQWLTERSSKPEVIAIGECGLDYYRLPDDPMQAKHIKAFQKKLLKLQIKVALEVDKPLLVHVRDAQDDAIALLEAHQPKGVLHCFSGDQTYLDRAIDLGLYISFAGNITFSKAEDLQTLLPVVPPKRLLLETDAPFLNPHRGQWPNVPGNIIKTYEFVANELQSTPEALSRLVQDNASRLFGI